MSCLGKCLVYCSIHIRKSSKKENLFYSAFRGVFSGRGGHCSYVKKNNSFLFVSPRVLALW